MGQVKRLHVMGARGTSPTSYVFFLSDIHNPHTLHSHGHTTCTCTHMYVSVYTQKKRLGDDVASSAWKTRSLNAHEYMYPEISGKITDDHQGLNSGG
jgi:hypothetical protein